MHTLLLIEDDEEISQLLSRLLGNDGYRVDCAYDGEQGLRQALSGDYDVIILDIMLPKRDGLDVLQNLRRQKNTPVLMLTARGDDIDRIIGFEMGADDYLPKPFNPRELAARLKAILRRVSLDRMETQDTSAIDLQFGPLTLSPRRREVRLRDELINLTSTEFNLLQYLLERPGITMDKNELTQAALGRQLSRYDRAIDMHVSNLRRKLEDALQIKTIRGIGYMLAEQEPNGALAEKGEPDAL